jgi:hypothetical protein
VWIGLTGTNADAKQLADVLGKELRVRWSARAMGNT